MGECSYSRTPQLPLSHTQMRWCSCWYGQAAVNRFDAGSIPATAACWSPRFSVSCTPEGCTPTPTEVIRLDEEPASKAGAGELSVVGSSPTASA